MRNQASGSLSALMLLAGFITGCTGVRPSSDQGPRIPLTPCQLSAAAVDTRLQARCGKLAVYENRVAQSGRQIELYIAVIPSISRTPAPDPLFFITGGPGEAATQDYVRMSSAFRRINEKRDIVLVDQRGTGQSHPLKCTNPAEETEENDKAPLKTIVDNCIKQFDADTRFYTTQAAVDDLDGVRAALGYDRINLYGVSYGTRVVQTYMRSYPRRVRTVIMDGVLPQDEALGVRIGGDAQIALDAVFARCAADADCRKAFPDLPGALQALMQRLEKTPVALTLEDPSTGKPTNVKFTRSKLGMAIRLFSYSPETAALLPLLIHDAHVTGDLKRLAAQAMIVSEQLEGNINMGLHNSIVCAEDVPFFRKNGRFVGNALTEEKAYLKGSYQALEKACQYWPAARVPADFKTPVQSDAPALLLSGEVDPVTPPSKAVHVAETIRHSLQIVAPGQAHGVIQRGCLYKLATEFVERGAVEGLDTRCVQGLKPAPFFLSYTGPKP